MISISDLQNELKNLQKTLNKIPSINDCKKFCKINPSTFSRRFGSWNKALLATFNTINIEAGSPKPIIQCLRCNKETQNKRYCSHSCAASTTNRITGRRVKKQFTCICGSQISRTVKNKLCKPCISRNRLDNFGEKIISDFRSTFARHKYQLIRHHAHRVANFHKIDKKCQVCNYAKHTELCHKKAIKDFTKDTKLSEVNALANLVFLCPTHHWELENGDLTN